MASVSSCPAALTLQICLFRPSFAGRHAFVMVLRSAPEVQPSSTPSIIPRYAQKPITAQGACQTLLICTCLTQKHHFQVDCIYL